VLVRSWNVFHGRTHPEGRSLHLREMVELATADRPAVLCLQELPLWSLRRLDDWSGMRACTAVAKRTLVPRLAGRILQRLDPQRIRSGVTGQGNAILLDRRFEVHEHRVRRISDRGRERRVCHAVRIDGFVIGNVHATNDFGRPEIPREELRRAYDLIDEMVAGGEARVLAGDFNLRAPELPGPNIDHVVVAGASHGPLVVWERERRQLQNGGVLSDHAPVEVEIA
jgi:endonuclease/exonuclease/phosphatase family metal-dependent hydrolase